MWWQTRAGRDAFASCKFDKIARLPRDVDDRDRQIAVLTAQLRTRDAASAQLTEFAGIRGPAALWNVFVNTLGNAATASFVTASGFVVGALGTKGFGVLRELVIPHAAPVASARPEFPLAVKT